MFRTGFELFLNPLNANPTKWPNTLKQFIGKLPTICLSVFDHFVKLALKGLSIKFILLITFRPIDSPDIVSTNTQHKYVTFECCFLCIFL